MARLGKLVGVSGVVVSSMFAVGAPTLPTVSAAAGSVVAITPVRLLETRSGSGLITVDGVSQGVGRLGAGQTREVVVRGRGGISENATSVFLNVVAVNPSGPGFLTVFPCGSPRPEASTVNYSGGDVVNNAGLAKIGNGGKICVYSLTSADVVVDATGYVVSGGDVTAVTPARVYESRPGLPTIDGVNQGTGRLRAGTTTAFQVLGRGGVSRSAAAVFLNLVVVGPAGPGFVTVFPCGSVKPETSSVNHSGGDVVGNAVMVKVGTNGRVCVFTLTDTDVVVDVTGYARNSGAISATRPARLSDSRAGMSTIDGRNAGGGRIAAGRIAEVVVTGRGGVATNASAVFVNLVAVAPTGDGFLTVYPCGAAFPTASTVNYRAGQVVAKSTLAAVGRDGKVCVFSLSTADVVVDVTGFTIGGAVPPPATVPPVTTPPADGMQIPGIVPTRGPGRSSNAILREYDGFTGTYNGLGEVRLTCGVSHHAYDDPIVFPGQTGASHLHTFFGNAGTNASSTYESLRAEPKGSTCAGGAVNKSAYWFPALIDRSANKAMNPVLGFVYYKTGYWGQDGRDIKDIPSGLRMISGNAAATRSQAEWNVNWACVTDGGFGVPGDELARGPSIPNCSQGNLLELTVMFPQCWNGRDLDSADHKSHMAHPSFQGQCPGTHPVIIPQITVHATWKMGPSGTQNVYLSSDMMLPPGSPPGQGLHADFMEGWEPTMRTTFVESCLNARKDCAVRSLGDGYNLIDP